LDFLGFVVLEVMAGRRLFTNTHPACLGVDVADVAEAAVVVEVAVAVGVVEVVVVGAAVAVEGVVVVVVVVVGADTGEGVEEAEAGTRLTGAL
jgi:hypothetical protein